MVKPLKHNSFKIRGFQDTLLKKLNILIIISKIRFFNFTAEAVWKRSIKIKWKLEQSLEM